MKRTYVFSFYGKKDSNGFSLPGGNSSAYSLRDQLNISDKRSTLPTTPIPKTVLSFRTTTGNKYDDGVSSFQQMTCVNNLLAFTDSKSTIETIQKGVKYVQSSQ